MNKVKRFNSEFRGMIEHPKGQFVFAADFYELKAQRDALAAENVALRNAHPQPFGREMMKAIEAYQAKEYEVPEQGMMDAFFILRDSIRISQEQTDAYLNSVRAEGVDYAAGRLVTYEAFLALAHRAQAAEAKLVAMTGQPVKQPQTHDAHGFPQPAHILNSRWIESIRAAGHEVQE